MSMNEHDARHTLDLVDGLDSAECGLRAAHRAALALGHADLARELDTLHGRLTNAIPRDLWRRAGEARDTLGGFADVLTGDDGLDSPAAPERPARCPVCGGPLVPFAGVGVCVGCPAAA